jgi:hypothetical protein
MIASNTPTALAQTTFTSFTSTLEGIHDSVHVWVGGTMGFIATAPADPIFWMHHCNIDRLWWTWQTSPQGAGQNPPLSGGAAVMDPWPTTEPDTRDITALGYEYASPKCSTRRQGPRMTCTSGSRRFPAIRGSSRTTMRPRQSNTNAIACATWATRTHDPCGRCQRPLTHGGPACTCSSSSTAIAFRRREPGFT